MALPSTIHRVAIDLSDLDCGRYTRIEATVARHPPRPANGWSCGCWPTPFCYDEDLVFTRDLRADEPDLWVKRPDGRVQKWIEVGLPDPERLHKTSATQSK